MNFNDSELIEYLDSIRELAESEFGSDFKREKRQLLYEEIKRRIKGEKNIDS